MIDRQETGPRLRFSFPTRCAPLVFAFVLAGPADAASLAEVEARSQAAPETSAARATNSYACWMLGDALEDLRRLGLRLVYSSDLVRPEMQILPPPDETPALDAATSPRQQLDALLAPFGLEARENAGLLKVVRRAGVDKGAQPTPSPVVDGSVLPLWLDRASSWVEIPFPGPVLPLESDTAYLVFDVVANDFPSWEKAAFALKQQILDAKARHKGLKVALSGQPSTLDNLVGSGLAPYVDGYVYREQPFAPSADPTARRWWKKSASAEQVLGLLLEAGGRGDALVFFPDLELDAAHQEWLRRIQTTPVGEWTTPPRVHGIDPSRVKFFLDPESRDHYLAIYAPLGQTTNVRFLLGDRLVAEGLYPKDADFRFTQFTGAAELELGGASPYYWLRFETADPLAESKDLEVRSTPVIDPYDEVVKNQVFQRKQAEKFQSLDVMEYIHNFPEAHANPYTWEHRILQRKGQLTDYHHLGLWHSGVRYPEEKLLMGRLFRNEALIQLNPLAVELDATYRYEYLGAEILDGRPTYRIGFAPLVEGSVDGGTFVSGILWLDQNTSAHLKVRTEQRGLDGSLLSETLTYFYEWIPSAGQCFWDWRRRDGLAITTRLGQQQGLRSETVRENFRYNRPDIDEIVSAAYASDIMIHVETPPHGHRWLVKDAKGRRQPSETPPALEMASDPTPPVAESSPAADSTSKAAANPTTPAATPRGGRYLADIHEFSSHFHLALDTYSYDSAFDLYPGLVFNHEDLFARGYQGYFGFFLEDALASLSVPNLFGKGWILTSRLDFPYSSRRYRAFELEGETWRDTSLRLETRALSTTLAIPLDRHLTLDATYGLRQLDFSPASNTDAGLVLPQDGLEHVFGAKLLYRSSSWHAELGFEAGQRSDWQPWGLDGKAELHDHYHLARLQVGSFRALDANSTVGATLTLIQGWDLDRFSRVDRGRSRAFVAGFDTGLPADEAALASFSLSTQLWKKLPIVARADLGRHTVDGIAESRLGLHVRVRINGPFKTDLWPLINVPLYSSRENDFDDITFGLTLSRSY